VNHQRWKIKRWPFDGPAALGTAAFFYLRTHRKNNKNGSAQSAIVTDSSSYIIDSSVLIKRMGLSSGFSDEHRKIDQGVLHQVCVDLNQTKERITFKHPFLDSCRDFIKFPRFESLGREIQQTGEVLDFFDVKNLLRFQKNGGKPWITILGRKEGQLVRLHVNISQLLSYHQQAGLGWGSMETTDISA
jgi:hypothetical protein